MPGGLPGVDVKFLINVASRLTERRLHAYHPGSRRSAAALILRFDNATQRTLTAALASFRTVHPSTSTAKLSSSTAPLGTNDVDFATFLRHVQDHHVDPAAPSALQLLFLKRADMDASRWSGQVAFPGGRRDPDDADDFATVCRETDEELGLPLQHHREFVCLGRLPDHNLRSRAVNSSGVVQARFVFLHVGDLTPTVRVATHVVERVRWMPLRRLTAAHVEHGCVVHPLQSFVHPQDADYRLLLTELFPSSYLTFPSVSLPTVEGEEKEEEGEGKEGAEAARKSVPRSWRVWGLTLRSANELLALDNRQPFDWPLVDSNSRVLQCCLLFPFHGYYELLYQYYLRRAWLSARVRVAVRRTRVTERDRRVLYGSVMDRRYAALPVSADALLFAAPEQPVPAHVTCLVGLMAAAVALLYTVASVVGAVFAAVGMAVGVEAALERERRRAAYYADNVHRIGVAVVRQPEVGEGVVEERKGREGGDESATAAATMENAAPPAAPPSTPQSWWRDGGRAGRTGVGGEAALAVEVGNNAERSERRADSAEAPLQLSHGGDGAAPSGEGRRSHTGESARAESRHPAEEVATAAPSQGSERPTMTEAAPLVKSPPESLHSVTLVRAAADVRETSHEDELQAVMDRYRTK